MWQPVWCAQFVKKLRLFCLWPNSNFAWKGPNFCMVYWKWSFQTASTSLSHFAKSHTTPGRNDPAPVLVIEDLISFQTEVKIPLACLAQMRVLRLLLSFLGVANFLTPWRMFETKKTLQVTLDIATGMFRWKICMKFTKCTTGRTTYLERWLKPAALFSYWRGNSKSALCSGQEETLWEDQNVPAESFFLTKISFPFPDLVRESLLAKCSLLLLTRARSWWICSILTSWAEWTTWRPGRDTFGWTPYTCWKMVSSKRCSLVWYPKPSWFCLLHS